MPNDVPDWLNSADVISRTLYSGGLASGAHVDVDASPFQSLVLAPLFVPGAAGSLAVAQYTAYPIGTSDVIEAFGVNTDGINADNPTYRIAVIGAGVRVSVGAGADLSSLQVYGSNRPAYRRLDANSNVADAAVWSATVTGNGFTALPVVAAGHLSGSVYLDAELLAPGAATVSFLVRTQTANVNLFRGNDLVAVGANKVGSKMAALPSTAYWMSVFTSGFAANFTATIRAVAADL